MTLSVALAASNAGLAAQVALANSGTLVVYSGTKPSNGDTALSGNTVLATESLASTAFAVAGRTATIQGTPLTCTIAASGTASFFRILKSDGTTVLFQGDVTVTGGGGELTFATTTFTSGVTATVSSFTLTGPS